MPDAEFYCPNCTKPVTDPLVCGDCHAVICRVCGTPLEHVDDLERTIAGIGREPLLESVGDLLRGTDEERQFVQCATPTVCDEIARGRMTLAAEADDAVQDGP